MSKKVKLDVSDIEYSFSIVGIVSTEPIFKLAWLLNKNLNLKLVDAKPIKNENQLEFLQFQYADKEKEISYSLIQNKNANVVLIKEHKNIDFIMKIIGDNLLVDELCSKIRNIENITAALNINK